MHASDFISSAQLIRDATRPEAVSENTRGVNARLAQRLATNPVPQDRAALRALYARGDLSLPVGPRSPRARTTTIAGPGGDVGLRILVPDMVRGAYLHLHGGGWTAGTNDMWDAHLELLGRETGLVAVSAEYRLAPENAFPAAIDDCVAAARWLIEHARSEFGVSWLAVGGESAGAHLSVATLLRLRDEGRGDAFRAVNLMYGCFDLSLSPSMRQGEATPIIDRAGVESLSAGFCGTADPRDPRVSPLFADLHGLPPALVSVGTLDPLLDDSLFMHARWQAAGNEADLALYPGGVHGFSFLDGDLAKEANLTVARFLRGRQPEAAGA